MFHIKHPFTPFHKHNPFQTLFFFIEYSALKDQSIRNADGFILMYDIKCKDPKPECMYQFSLLPVVFM